MSGASSRRKGHETERIIARWLRLNGFPDACTTRSKLGHDGTHTPGDVDFHPLIVLESKFVESGSAWPTWCRQAAAEASVGTIPVVVRRTRGVPDVGAWECRVLWAAFRIAAGDVNMRWDRLVQVNHGTPGLPDYWTWNVTTLAALVDAVRTLAVDVEESPS